jgi:hypothetical protein
MSFSIFYSKNKYEGNNVVNLGKNFLLLLIVSLAILGVLLVEPVVAPVTMPTNPSPAPEIISAVAHDDPEWMPPIYSTNPYTGEVTTIYSAYWRPNGTVEITIKNPSFNSYTDKNGNVINIYYTIFIQYDRINFPWSQFDRPRYAMYQSGSDYTVITLTYGGGKLGSGNHLGLLSSGTVLYCRVQAVEGYFQGKAPYIVDSVFEGEGSEWTEFSLTLPKMDTSGTSTVKPSSTSYSGAPLTSDNYNGSQQKPFQFNMVIVRVVVVLGILIVLLAVTVVIYRLRKPENIIIEKVHYLWSQHQTR